MRLHLARNWVHLVNFLPPAVQSVNNPVVEPSQVTLASIEAAAERLDGVLADLPIAGARWLSAEVGGPVYLIPENLQRAGSFKIRGAYNRISQLSDAEKERGVVAASAGNHAQGVAVAAQMLGVRATVFMPAGASIPKVTATRAYGADVELVGSTIDDALVTAREFAEKTGAVLIHPFDHVDVVSGQGTLGLEILKKVPDVNTVVVCTGGGGLLAGMATAIKAKAPHVQVFGVQASGAAAYPASFAAGHPVALTSMSTMADGIAVGRPGDVPFELVREHADGIITVSEESLSRALLMLLERAKLVVEPSGAAGVAAVMDDPQGFVPPVAIVLSGGNIDPLLLLRVIRHGLVAAGRYLALRFRVKDRPGSLSELLRQISATGANVVEIDHDRFDSQLRVDEVEILIQLETRGSAHRDEVINTLRELGFEFIVL